jgi:hypothetical protein
MWIRYSPGTIFTRPFSLESFTAYIEKNSLAILSDFESLQIWVYGNSFESCLVAVVNPNMQGLERWAESKGVSGDFASICADPKAKEFILEQLSKTGKEKKVRC